MKKIIVLLIEDNRLLRDGILRFLKPYGDIVVIASSGEGENIYLKVQQLKPNVVLLDLGLRNQNSLHVVELVKKELPQAKIIVMDLTPDQADILQYIKAGANGFILKDASPKDFLTTIRSVEEGSTILPSLLVNSLFSQIVNYAVRDSEETFKESVLLTKRERVVITLLSDGLSNKEIGQQMFISTYTVKSHIHNIMEKLSLHTRLEIANHSYSTETLKPISSSISTMNN